VQSGTTNARSLNIHRFSFTSAAVSRKPSPSVLAPPQPPIALPSKITPYQRPSSKKPSSIDVSKSELDKISRCICCNISWTTRKTSAQKLSHIQSCARKHAFNEETVRVLLQKEVSASVPQPEPSALKATTFLEDLVVDTAPRKKTRRRQVETQLSNTSQTREAILFRAQNLLTNIVSDESAQVGASNSNHLSNGVIPPSTQVFHRSALGQQQVSSKRTLFSGDDGEPTQPFAESGLGRLQASKSRSLFTSLFLDDGGDGPLVATSSRSSPSSRVQSHNTQLSPRADIGDRLGSVQYVT